MSLFSNKYVINDREDSSKIVFMDLRKFNLFVKKTGFYLT